MIRRSWTQAASIEETLALWAASLREVKKRIRPLFGQERVARNAGLFLEGLLGDEQRKTGWMRAEAAGDPGPWRQQAILGRRHWDGDALRDIVRDYVIEHLADDDAVLVVDETGFLKQGNDKPDHVMGSIARPGGKATAVSCMSTDLAGKRLQLLKELVPALVNIAALYNPGDRTRDLEYKQVQEAANSLDLKLRAYQARSATEIEEAFALMAGEHLQALVILSDVLMNVNVKTLADLSLSNRLPAIYPYREFVDMGGLISYGNSLSGMWRRAAPYVDKILKGADPGELPIDQPTRFELVVNLKTAKTLGIQVPATLLVLADELIE
jgi:hypothetical protein